MKSLLIVLIGLTLLFPQGVVAATPKNTAKKCVTEQKALAKLDKKADSIEGKYDRKIKQAKKAKKDYYSIESAKYRDIADVAIKQLSAQSAYNSCLGIRTHIPSNDPYTASTPSALCRDGSYSYSKTRSGTCSWHGGVLTWF